MFYRNISRNAIVFRYQASNFFASPATIVLYAECLGGRGWYRELCFALRSTTSPLRNSKVYEQLTGPEPKKERLQDNIYCVLIETNYFSSRFSYFIVSIHLSIQIIIK